MIKEYYTINRYNIGMPDVPIRVYVGALYYWSKYTAINVFKSHARHLSKYYHVTWDTDTEFICDGTKYKLEKLS